MKILLYDLIAQELNKVVPLPPDGGLGDEESDWWGFEMAVDAIVIALLHDPKFDADKFRKDVYGA